MRNLKAVRYKTVLAGALTVLWAACFAVTVVHAQDAEPVSAPQEQIIDEALDRVEQSLIPDGTRTQGSAAESGVELGTVTPSGEIAVRLDESEESLAVKVIPLLHAEASGLVEELEQMKSPNGEVSYSEEDRALILRDRPEQLEVMSALVRRKDVLLETEIFMLEFIAAGDLVGEVGPVLTEDVGQVHVDGEANTLIVTDTPVAIARVKGLVRKRDVFSADILVGTKVVEIVLNDEHLDGIDWEAIVSEYQEMTVDDGGPSGSLLSLGTVSSEDYDILLEALDTVGALRTVSQEDVQTENGVTGFVNGPLRADASANIRFAVTPLVGREGPLEVVLAARPDGAGALTVRMQDGETIVVGGLFREVTVASTWKVPLLGDLPLLGFVFRNDGKEARKAEVITFLTVKTVEKGS